MLAVTVAAPDAGVTVFAVGEVDMHTAPTLAEVLDAGCEAANRRGPLVVAPDSVLRPSASPAWTTCSTSSHPPMRTPANIATAVTSYSSGPQALSGSRTGSTVHHMAIPPTVKDGTGMKHRILLLASVTATLSVGAFFVQGWRAALFALLGGVVVTGLVAFGTRRTAGKD